MLTELISLPLRATRLWLRGADKLLELAQQVLVGNGDVVPGGRPAPDPEPDSIQPRPEPSGDDATSRDRQRVARPSASTAPQPTPGDEPQADRSPRAEIEPEPTPSGDLEPAHVSEEPTLVEEVAEPGAEDGAGAQVNVEEPWPGYRRMSARDVLNRLDAASPAELAAIQLYERAHRARQTVLTEADRRLRSRSGIGSRT